MGEKVMDNRELSALHRALLAVMDDETAEEHFNAPVDPVALGIPDYTEVVRKPMDLGTVEKRIRRQLEGGGDTGAVATSGTMMTSTTAVDGDGGGDDNNPVAYYASLSDALEDIRQVWRNCKRYNSHPSHSQLRASCDRLDDILVTALTSSTSTSTSYPAGAGAVVEKIKLPGPRVPAGVTVHPDTEMMEEDVPEVFGMFLPGEDLPYRMLDGFIVSRR